MHRDPPRPLRKKPCLIRPHAGNLAKHLMQAADTQIGVLMPVLRGRNHGLLLRGQRPVQVLVQTVSKVVQLQSVQRPGHRMAGFARGKALQFLVPPDTFLLNHVLAGHGQLIHQACKTQGSLYRVADIGMTKMRGPIA